MLCISMQRSKLSQIYIYLHCEDEILNCRSTSLSSQLQVRIYTYISINIKSDNRAKKVFSFSITTFYCILVINVINYSLPYTSAIYNLYLLESNLNIDFGV